MLLVFLNRSVLISKSQFEIFLFIQEKQINLRYSLGAVFLEILECLLAEVSASVC